jgi:hypothetical protein
MPRRSKNRSCRPGRLVIPIYLRALGSSSLCECEDAGAANQTSNARLLDYTTTQLPSCLAAWLLGYLAARLLAVLVL